MYVVYNSKTRSDVFTIACTINNQKQAAVVTDSRELNCVPSANNKQPAHLNDL